MPLRCHRLGVFLATLAASASALAAPLPGVPDEDYALLSSAIAHGLGPEAKRIVIADMTSGDPSAIVAGDAKFDELAEKLATTPALLRRWATLNQRRYPLTKRFTLPLAYELLLQADREMIFSGPDPAQGWQRFFTRYPDAPGLLQVSRVAVDDAAQNALVYIEFQCGANCGAGRLVQMQRAPDQAWRVQAGELIWIAGP